MISRVWKLAWLPLAVVGALLLVGSEDELQAGGGPRDVVVVINADSADSVTIGRYYQAARGIPDRNVCVIRCPKDEVVSWQVCESKIRSQLCAFLDRPEIREKIDYIVLTKGIPLSADCVDGIVDGDLDPVDGQVDVNHYYSVESVLLDLHTPLVDLTGTGGVPDGKPDNASPYVFPYGPCANSIWSSYGAPETAWSHSLFHNGDKYELNKRYYLITRLDGFTVSDVLAMIDRSCQPALDGIFALDRNTWNTGAYKTANYRLGNLTSSAYDFLVKSGHEVVYDAGTDFFSNLRGLMGYFSWASHDSMYSFSKYTSNLFVPGSVADTYYSYSGRTFVNPGTTNRSPLIADLFGCGLCGAGGYVSEPYITTATYPNVLFDRYTKGYNMAESFYAACPDGMWKTVIVGDPLMSPYATPPQVSIDLQDNSLQGVETVNATAYDQMGVSKVAFYLDDNLVCIDGQAPFSMTLDTNELPIGAHELEAVAYENSPVGTQGFAAAQVVIDNLVSTVPSLQQACKYADGQAVRVREKVVTAGTDEMGGTCFILEEPDRSSAVEVDSSFVARRGDVITFTGTMGSGAGDRVVKNPMVTLVRSGETVPAPVMMKLSDLGGAPRGSYTEPVGAGMGARNVNLLVRVMGKVVSATDGEILIADGSVSAPVKVVCPGLTALTPNTWVCVTGICRSELSGARYVPTIRARKISDVLLL